MPVEPKGSLHVIGDDRDFSHARDVSGMPELRRSSVARCMMAARSGGMRPALAPAVATFWMSANGTKLPIRDVRSSVATRGKPDMAHRARIGSA